MFEIEVEWKKPLHYCAVINTWDRLPTNEHIKHVSLNYNSFVPQRNKTGFIEAMLNIACKTFRYFVIAYKETMRLKEVFINNITLWPYLTEKWINLWLESLNLKESLIYIVSWWWCPRSYKTIQKKKLAEQYL